MIRKKKLAKRENYGAKRALSSIKYIVLHYTANDGDTDEGNANYFANNTVLASAHYFVDDDSCTQSVPDEYVAYSVGGKKYSNTKGGSLHGKATNSNTLNIEMCDTVRNGNINPTEKTLANTVQLVKEKMQQYNIPIQNVIRHYDVTGKRCPAYFVNDVEWKKFKDRLTASPAGWKKNSIGWWWQNADGSYPINTWKKIADKWYYFGEKGYMAIGWKKLGGKWYWMDASGAMATGWKFIGNMWYYFNPDGAMLENQWLNDENKWYWLQKGGCMARNQILTVNGQQYAFLSDGHMAVSDVDGHLR